VRTLLMGLTLAVSPFAAQAQDPGMMAAQQAQMATQAAQQANQQAMQAAQIANQNAISAQQQAVQNTQCYRCGVATPKFSAKPGEYSSPVTVKIRDAGRGAVIYYTTDGWTPNRGVNPIHGSDHD
jgi:chitobiase/beta-hexosaminidase-like protein